MPIGKKETSFEIEFDLESIPKPLRRGALHDVGEYLIEAILDHIGEGKSPVAGVSAFKKLSKPYADEEKMGDRLPNLDLHGSMLDSLKYKIQGDKVIVGIFDGDQAIKAYGHITGFEGHPWLDGVAPVRKFLPDDAEGDYLKADILTGVSRIIEEYVDENIGEDE
jgi:hypothetical protein